MEGVFVKAAIKRGLGLSQTLGLIQLQALQFLLTLWCGDVAGIERFSPTVIMD